MVDVSLEQVLEASASEDGACLGGVSGNRISPSISFFGAGAGAGAGLGRELPPTSDDGSSAAGFCPFESFNDSNIATINI